MELPASSLFALIIVSLFIFPCADANVMDKPKAFFKSIEDYADNMAKDAMFEVQHPIDNNNMSIQYQLFTPNNPKRACILLPTNESLRSCSFSSDHDTKVITHGFMTKLGPGNLFHKMKDSFLKKGQYNIIVVNWTLYNQPPYPVAMANTYLVGRKLADLLKFLQSNAGLRLETTHLIGHSLGAHTSGHAGAQSPNLGRITGLDPAGPLFEVPLPFHELSYNDANFVDIIHSSDRTHGLGLYRPIGHMDFYPNGGMRQPKCVKKTNKAKNANTTEEVKSYGAEMLCNHSMANNYFLASISDCHFLATKCSSYLKFKKGDCTPDNSVVARMGVPNQKNPKIPTFSRFFLTTGHESPYCSKST